MDQFSRMGSVDRFSRILDVNEKLTVGAETAFIGIGISFRMVGLS